jgi:hypothetical protein
MKPAIWVTDVYHPILGAFATGAILDLAGADVPAALLIGLLARAPLQADS